MELLGPAQQGIDVRCSITLVLLGLWSRLLLADQHSVPDSLLTSGLGRWIKNRFQNCLKSASKPAARWYAFLLQGVNYFEYGKAILEF